MLTAAISCVKAQNTDPRYNHPVRDVVRPAPDSNLILLSKILVPGQMPYLYWVHKDSLGLGGSGGSNFSGSWNDLTDIPLGFADGTDDEGSGGGTITTTPQLIQYGAAAGGLEENTKLFYDETALYNINGTVPTGLISPYAVFGRPAGNASSSMYLLSGSNRTGRFYFGDQNDSDVGGVTYDHTNDLMEFRVGAQEYLGITGTSIFGKLSVSADNDDNASVSVKPSAGFDYTYRSENSVGQFTFGVVNTSGSPTRAAIRLNDEAGTGLFSAYEPTDINNLGIQLYNTDRTNFSVTSAGSIFSYFYRQGGAPSVSGARVAGFDDAGNLVPTTISSSTQATYQSQNAILNTTQTLGNTVFVGSYKYTVASDSLDNYDTDTIAVIPLLGGLYAVYNPETKIDICLWGASPDATREENTKALQSAINYHWLSGQGKPLHTGKTGTFEAYPVEAEYFRYSGNIESVANGATLVTGTANYTNWIFYPDPSRPAEKSAIRVGFRAEIDRFSVTMQDGLDTLIRLPAKPFHRIENSTFFASDDFVAGNPRYIVYGNDLLYPKFTDNEFRAPAGGYSLYFTSNVNYYAVNVGEINRNDFFGRGTGIAVGAGVLSIRDNTFEGFITDTVNAVRGAIELGFDSFAGQVTIESNYFEQSSRDSVYINAVLNRGGDFGKITLKDNRAYGPRPDFGTGGYPADTLSCFFRTTSLLREITSENNFMSRYNYGHWLELTSNSNCHFSTNNYEIDSTGVGEIFREVSGKKFPLYDYNNSTPSGLFSKVSIDEPDIGKIYTAGINKKQGVHRLFAGNTVIDLSLENHFQNDNINNPTLTTINESRHDNLVIYANQSCIFDNKQLQAGEVYEFRRFNESWVTNKAPIINEASGTGFPSPDANGDLTVTHDLGSIPNYAQVTHNGTVPYFISWHSATETEIKFRVLDSTGLPVTTGSVGISWTVKSL